MLYKAYKECKSYSIGRWDGFLYTHVGLRISCFALRLSWVIYWRSLEVFMQIVNDPFYSTTYGLNFLVFCYEANLQCLASFKCFPLSHPMNMI